MFHRLEVRKAETLLFFDADRSRYFECKSPIQDSDIKNIKSLLKAVYRNTASCSRNDATSM